MFKANNQPELFTFESGLSKKQRKLLGSSKEKWFYYLVLRNVKESDFKALYSDKASRPNAPVNILVSALVLKELKGISYNELMESVMFDLRFKTALGLADIGEVPFSRATLFNFQNRLLEYQQQTGLDLIEQVFDNLSAEQIKKLSVKADIQRTDSTLVSSNIKKYSRLQLLIEVLVRLVRILEEKDKQFIGEQLSPYLKKETDKYIYGLKANQLPHELEKLGKVYYRVFEWISKKEQYKDKQEFINFSRAYKEHFVVVESDVSPKPAEELTSSMLQSPDDPDATYRQKRGEHHKGFTINGTETANPENPVQLITDISVNPNNVDDSQILNERAEKIKEKTPELNEMHTDGGYGSEDNDKKFEEMGISQITTAVRGRESEIEKKIEQTSESPDVYTVECPSQKAESTPTKKRHKVRFDMEICRQCPLNEKCRIFKNKGRYYFTHEDYLQNRRNRNIMNIPRERRKIRPNVEALMNEFKIRTPGGKLKVRGLFKATLFAFNSGIAINFGRIYRYAVKNGLTEGIDPSTPAILDDIMLITARLLQKTSISVRNFFTRWFCLEYFYPKAALSLNMAIMRTLNLMCF
ncbi:MAG: transposase [Bacteroidales bacterium]|nr:transposase [Bacteroidales bacterium]